MRSQYAILLKLNYNQILELRIVHTLLEESRSVVYHRKILIKKITVAGTGYVGITFFIAFFSIKLGQLDYTVKSLMSHTL